MNPVCDVCRKKEAAGVYVCGVAPFSLSYCEACMSAGAEPLRLLARSVARNRDEGLSPTDVLEGIIESSLQAAGKSPAYLEKEIEKRRKRA